MKPFLTCSSPPQPLHRNAIRPAPSADPGRRIWIVYAGLTPSIINAIVENIQKTQIVIADLTEARPNCYYELGYSHALKKETVIISRRAEHIHFDVNQYSCIM